MVKKVKVVIGSHNEGKIGEIKKIIGLSQIEWLDFRNFSSFPQVKEEGKTFKENALFKAKTLSKWAGLPAIADDSGLEVEALGGAPGLMSARYASPKATDSENRLKLLKELREVPWEKREAQFRCVVAYTDLKGNTYFAEGILKGRIAFGPRGDEGFGYDPLFIPQSFKKTLAEFSTFKKNQISHRGQAFRKLKKLLEELL